MRKPGLRCARAAVCCWRLLAGAARVSARLHPACKKRCRRQLSGMMRRAENQLGLRSERGMTTDSACWMLSTGGGCACCGSVGNNQRETCSRKEGALWFLLSRYVSIQTIDWRTANSVFELKIPAGIFYGARIMVAGRMLCGTSYGIVRWLERKSPAIFLFATLVFTALCFRSGMLEGVTETCLST